jgi:tripartite-type tricarboxylate transporter receptor subunit TctC
MKRFSMPFAKAAARVTSVALVAALGATLPFATARAQTYPNQVIKIIIPFAAGGAVDLVGRPFAQKLSEALGQPVVIENRPGGNTVIGVNAVAKAAPDGYTMLLTTGSLITAPLMVATVPYDPFRELTTVTQLVYSQGTILATRPDFPAKTVAELVTLAKQNPGKFNYAHTGIGTPPYVAPELFRRLAGIDLVPVPYKGTGNVLTDVLGRQVDMTFSGIPSVMEYVRDGKVRALASTGIRRTAALPDVTTFQELGYAEMDIRGYYGLWLPSGTPRERVDLIHRASLKALADPEVRKIYGDGALEIVGSSPQEFEAFLHKDLERQTALMSLLGLRPAP